MNEIIRRKLSRAAAQGHDGQPGAKQAWPLAFARAVRDQVGLVAFVKSQRLDDYDLSELLEQLPDHALISLVYGPSDGLGLIALSASLFSALIEMQTLGSLGPQSDEPRRPSRTDAAMVCQVIDQALSELDILLSHHADYTWAAEFHYASFIEDQRPLGLLLEDQSYRVLRTQIALGEDGRMGEVIVALPSQGKAKPLPVHQRPAAFDFAGQPLVPDASLAATGFTSAFNEAVLNSSCQLNTTLTRVRLPLAKFLTLAPGEVILLPEAGVDHITVTGVDDQVVATARLGQARGMRALRIEKLGNLNQAAQAHNLAWDDEADLQASAAMIVEHEKSSPAMVKVADLVADETELPPDLGLPAQSDSFPAASWE